MTGSPRRYTRITADGQALERLAVYIPKGLKADMVQLAKSRGQSTTYAVTAAIRAAVDDANVGGVR